MSQATEEKPSSIAGERLLSIITRWERLEEEKKALSADQKDIMTEAKSAGFDQKIIRQLIAIRKKEPAEIAEAEQLLATYMHAIGMA